MRSVWALTWVSGIYRRVLCTHQKRTPQDRAADMGDNKGREASTACRISPQSKVRRRTRQTALVIRMLFDVFTDRMADMAKCNALVLPIIDAQRWYNYRYTSKDGGEQEREAGHDQGPTGRMQTISLSHSCGIRTA